MAQKPTHTYTCILMSTFAQRGWGGPLLHACSERSHPSRDQQTAVNPLLKILANPLGLLRIASGHCVCHKSGITQWRLSMVHQHLTHCLGMFAPGVKGGCNWLAPTVCFTKLRPPSWQRLKQSLKQKATLQMFNIYRAHICPAWRFMPRRDTILGMWLLEFSKTARDDSWGSK